MKAILRVPTDKSKSSSLLEPLSAEEDAFLHSKSLCLFLCEYSHIPSSRITNNYTPVFFCLQILCG